MTTMTRSLGQFYTPPAVAHALISMVDCTPANVIDLGCGPGALSRAAVTRWGARLRLTTIDIDPAAGPASDPWTTEHRHLWLDLLDENTSVVAIAPGTFDVAVLNPPYGRISKPDHGGDNGVGSAHATCHPTRCRATIFTLQALRAVRPGGLIAAILPDTLASSRLAAGNRALITAGASLRAIKLLPERTFPRTEARTIMVVLERVARGTGTAAPWFTPAAAFGVEDSSLTQLQELSVEIVRGNLSTPDARRERAFHLDGFAEARNGVVRLVDQPTPSDDLRTVRPGDILVARVGRSIPDKIARVEAGIGAISDCVYRLRCPPRHTDRVWRGLRSQTGRSQIEAGLSGLTTRVLPMSALLALRV